MSSFAGARSLLTQRMTPAAQEQEEPVAAPSGAPTVAGTPTPATVPQSNPTFSAEAPPELGGTAGLGMQTAEGTGAMAEGQGSVGAMPGVQDALRQRIAANAPPGSAPPPESAGGSTATDPLADVKALTEQMMSNFDKQYEARMDGITQQTLSSMRNAANLNAQMGRSIGGGFMSGMRQVYGQEAAARNQATEGLLGKQNDLLMNMANLEFQRGMQQNQQDFMQQQTDAANRRADEGALGQAIADWEADNNTSPGYDANTGAKKTYSQMTTGEQAIIDSMYDQLSEEEKAQYGSAVNWWAQSQPATKPIGSTGTVQSEELDPSKLQNNLTTSQFDNLSDEAKKFYKIETSDGGRTIRFVLK